MDKKEPILRLAMVGDIALGNHPKTPGFGFYSRYKGGIPSNLAERLHPKGKSSDVVFGNLEFPLVADDDHPGSEACCLGIASNISFLRQAGFTVLNVANNHSWDYGSSVFWGMVRELRSAGIKVVGIPEDFNHAGFLKIKGKTVAFLGCSARPRQGFIGEHGYNEFERDQFVKQIKKARQHADLVCVSIHWGEEFLLVPSPQEREIARSMIDAGASIVAGHHPHVLREVESYGDGIIAYSLGNFIGDMTWNQLNLETGCLMVEVEENLKCTSSFSPARIEPDFFPLYLDEPASRQTIESQERRRDNLKAALETTSYEALARKALIQHQWLTFLFFLKNLNNYRPAVLWKIVSYGIKVRVPGLNR